MTARWDAMTHRRQRPSQWKGQSSRLCRMRKNVVLTHNRNWEQLGEQIGNRMDCTPKLRHAGRRLIG